MWPIGTHGWWRRHDGWFWKAEMLMAKEGLRKKEMVRGFAVRYHESHV